VTNWFQAWLYHDAYFKGADRLDGFDFEQGITTKRCWGAVSVQIKALYYNWFIRKRKDGKTRVLTMRQGFTTICKYGGLMDCEKSSSKKRDFSTRNSRLLTQRRGRERLPALTCVLFFQLDDRLRRGSILPVWCINDIEATRVFYSSCKMGKAGGELNPSRVVVLPGNLRFFSQTRWFWSCPLRNLKESFKNRSWRLTIAVNPVSSVKSISLDPQFWISCAYGSLLASPYPQIVETKALCDEAN
jgi:hypothetical protein